MINVWPSACHCKITRLQNIKYQKHKCYVYTRIRLAPILLKRKNKRTAKKKNISQLWYVQFIPVGVLAGVLGWRVGVRISVLTAMLALSVSDPHSPVGSWAAFSRDGSIWSRSDAN